MRKSISVTAADYLLAKKLAEKLDLNPSLLVTALVRVEAKKRRVKVSDAEVADFLAQHSKARKPGKKSAAQDRAAKLFPTAFK